MTDANLDGLPDRTLATGTKWELVTMAYDAFGRLVSTNHIYADGATAGDPIPGQFSSDQWTTNYDIQGRVTQETSPTGVIGYEYDSLGRKTRTWAGGVGSTATTALSDITYTCDALGRLSTVNTVKRDGAIVDSNGATAGTPPESTIYHYDLLGRMDYTEMPNSVVEDYTFDNMDRLDVMRHYQSDANNADLTDNLLKDMFDYSYRADGKRTGLVETFKDSGIGVPPVNNNYLTNNYTWSYDNAGRLTSEVLDSSDNSLDQTESYIMDLVGNRIRRTIDKPGTVNDVTDIYTFNSSDQLQSENRFSGLFPTGTPGSSATQSTIYTWSGTQQASKAVSIPSTSTVTQSMTYGLTGQLEGVITETKNGSNAVTARAQVEYRYDNSGLRFIAIDSTDSNLNTLGIERTENGRTEYLLDHNNLTGYGQTIIETVKNASGQATKRTSYTIGTDEITQTVSTLDPATGNVTASEILTFGHDGHGSTRVLFGAAAAIAQVFTYSAYGELLAIHNGAGVRDATYGGTASTLANPAGAKTSLLYNGEGIDSRTGLYNFRARWYSASSGRFERLDPFAGNPNDPLSFNKYGAFHANPTMMTDPTGLFGFGGISVSISIGGMLSGMRNGAVVGAALGGAIGFADGFSNNGSIDDAMEGFKSGVFYGAIFGAVTGGVAGGFVVNGASTLLKLRVLKGMLALNLAATGYGVYSAKSITQGVFRSSLGLLGFALTLSSMKQVATALASERAADRASQAKALAQALDNDGGHSYGKHGAHTTAQQHETRLRTGVAPNGQAGNPPPASGAFATNEKQLEAYEKALTKLWEDPPRANGSTFKGQHEIELDLPGAGTSYTLDAAGSLIARQVNRVQAFFRLDASGQDYDLITMYPIP